MGKGIRSRASGWLAICALFLGLCVASVAQRALAAPPESEMAKRQQTLERLQGLLRGIVGDASKVGYLGDMGAVPESLAALVAASEAPGYSTANRGFVGMGFNGPYAPAAGMVGGQYVDAWGSPIVLEMGDAAVRLRSAGPDRDFDTAQDDVVFPVGMKTTHGRIEVEVVAVDPDGSQIGLLDDGDVLVRVYSAASGIETSALASHAAGANRFSLDDVHLGRHYVEAVGLDGTDYSSIAVGDVLWLKGRAARLKLSLVLEADTDTGTVICHKPDGPQPRTKTVHKASLDAHLGHGDALGPCADD